MRVISVTLLSIAIVGTRGASEAPSSEAPSSEAPSSETSHSYVVSRLNSVFGEENCSITNQEEDPSGFAFLDRMNTRRMVCTTVESPCFSGVAEYFWLAEELEPKYLTVAYGYPAFSGSTNIDFSDDGGYMRSVEPYLRSISLNTLDGVPITTACSDGPSPQPVPAPTIAPVVSIVFEPVNPNVKPAKAETNSFVVSNVRRPRRVAPYLP